MLNKEVLEKFYSSVVKKYDRGYVLCRIDDHPYGDFFRSADNGLGYYAEPDEVYVLLRCGVVCCFLHDDADEIGETERVYNLIRVENGISTFLLQ